MILLFAVLAVFTSTLDQQKEEKSLKDLVKVGLNKSADDNELKSRFKPVLSQNKNLTHSPVINTSSHNMSIWKLFTLIKNKKKRQVGLCLIKGKNPSSGNTKNTLQFPPQKIKCRGELTLSGIIFRNKTINGIFQFRKKIWTS